MKKIWVDIAFIVLACLLILAQILSLSGLWNNHTGNALGLIGAVLILIYWVGSYRRHRQEGKS